MLHNYISLTLRLIIVLLLEIEIFSDRCVDRISLLSLFYYRKCNLYFIIEPKKKIDNKYNAVSSL